MLQIMDRRALLQASGALVATFSLPFARAAAQTTVGKTVSPDRVDGFIAITADGRVTACLGKIDLGTESRSKFCIAAARARTHCATRAPTFSEVQGCNMRSVNSLECARAILT
jgi:hypothetical protein